jgi:hypothetical protein
VRDQSFYLCFNSWDQPIDFLLPPEVWGAEWEVVVDTSALSALHPRRPERGAQFAFAQNVPLQGHHFVALCGLGPTER